MGRFLAVASFHNNPDEHIDLTFDNVLKQTHNDWLLIVADDGSKDPEFRRRLRKRVEELNDKRIIYYHLENRRELYLYQNTFQHLEYDYYFDLDTDDILDKELFEIYDNHFQAYPQVYSIFSDYFQTTPNGDLEQWSLVQPADDLALEWNFRHNSEFWEIYSNRNTQKMFGHGRAMRKPDVSKLPIVKECKTSTDTFFLFYNTTRGKHVHIPRNLYTYVRRPGSDSGSMTEQEHAEFNINAKPLIESSKPHNTLFLYEDVWHITSAIQACEWLNDIKEFSVYTETEITQQQKDKINFLYPSKNIKFNQPHNNIIVAWANDNLSSIPSKVGNDFQRFSMLVFNDATQVKTTEYDLNEWTNILINQTERLWPDGNWYCFFRQFRYTIDRVGNKPICRFYHRSGPELHCDWAPEDKSYEAQFWLKDKMHLKVDLFENLWSRYAMDWYERWECRIVKKKTNQIVQVLKPEEREIGIQFESSSLGDTISWMGQVEELKQQRDYDTIYVRLYHQDLFDWSYYRKIGIIPVSPHEYWPQNWQTLGVYQEDNQPSVKHKHKRDWRTVPIGAIAADRLGIIYVERKPKMAPIFYQNTLIEDKDNSSVCIAPRGTAGAKEWQHPTGWQDLINEFKTQNWDVHYCSKETTHLQNIERVSDGSESSLFKVGQQMRASGYFIGIGSGLSWLAWALDIKVCLISGFTWSFIEFEPAIRIINTNVCSGCWTYHVFDRGDWNWCPEHKDTPRHFECTKTITPEYVWQKLKQDNWI